MYKQDEQYDGGSQVFLLGAGDGSGRQGKVKLVYKMGRKEESQKRRCGMKLR